VEGGEGSGRWGWERDELKRNWGEWNGYNIVGRILEIRGKSRASTRSEVAGGWVGDILSARRLGRRWEGEREDGDGGMNFWVKTRSEVARGWAAWSSVLGGWVLMVAGGWLSARGVREREDGRWRSAGDEMSRAEKF
jgi:hypothetical protein